MYLLRLFAVRFRTARGVMRCLTACFLHFIFTLSAHSPPGRNIKIDYSQLKKATVENNLSALQATGTYPSFFTFHSQGQSHNCRPAMNDAGDPSAPETHLLHDITFFTCASATFSGLLELVLSHHHKLNTNDAISGVAIVQIQNLTLSWGGRSRERGAVPGFGDARVPAAPEDSQYLD
ncbi:hypothetical protein B0H19DRAFT_1075933 [Mycena capillaripes]|nr:hypothetical protein B0H19DRAFT_1075933 [Mycena capillaripes]